MHDRDEDDLPTLGDEERSPGDAFSPRLSPPLVRTTPASEAADVFGRVDLPSFPDPGPPGNPPRPEPPPPPPLSPLIVAAATTVPAGLVALVWLWPSRGAFAASLTALVVGASVKTMALQAREQAQIVGPKAWLLALAGAAVIVFAYLAAIDPVAFRYAWLWLGLPLVFAIQLGFGLSATPARPAETVLTRALSSVDYRGSSEVVVDRENAWQVSKRDAVIAATLAGLASGIVMRSVIEAGDGDGIAAGGMAVLWVVSARRLALPVHRLDAAVRALRWSWGLGLFGAALLTATMLEWRSTLTCLPIHIAAVVWTRVAARAKRPSDS